MLEVTGRNVDGHAQSGAPGDRAAPGAHFAAGPPHHPTAQLDDLAAFLGNLDEAIGHQHAQFRVLPAHQRLDAQQTPAAKIDDRLILYEELLVSDRARDVGHQPHALLQHFLHGRLERHETVLARGLGVIHRDVGLAQ